MATPQDPSSAAPPEPPRHGPPAGWYSDPAGGVGSRWWDGVGWTEHVRSTAPTLTPDEPVDEVAPASPMFEHAEVEPPSSATPSSAPSFTPDGFATYPAIPIHTDYRAHLLGDVVPRERSSARWGQRALVLYGASMLGHGVLGLIYRAQLAQVFHWIHEVFIAAENGSGSHLPSAPVSVGNYASWSDIDNLALALGIILFLVWQHRASSTARLLGVPSRLAPGFGVFAWFIPVVNLVLPGIVFADLLPKGHHSRRSLILWWVGIEVGSILSAVVFILAPYHHVVSAALLGVDGLIWIWIVTEGVHLIHVVTHAHQEIASR